MGIASFSLVRAILVSAVVSPRSEAISCTTRICFSITLSVISTVCLRSSASWPRRVSCSVTSRMREITMWYCRS